ncbi:MAG: glycogen debranching protein, partial [Thermomicrobiaceae bacterium]|nr:glycogen debranching protein [Thermomicrobiaceae bacterium]
MRTRYWRCTRLSALIAVLALLALPLGAVAAPQPGGPTRPTSERLAQKRYVAAGDRAYVFGAEDGSFPPMGWHIRGEIGGVWAHPIKLLDGYWFSVNGRWLPAATRFISGAGYVQMTFPAVNGVQVTRTECAPDGSPVVLIGLTFRWVSGPPRAIRLTMDVRSELMGAYPWGWTTPSAKEANGKDAGSYDQRTGTLAFREPGKPWVALVRGATDDARRTTGRVGDEIWGPVPPDQRAGYLENGNGTGGELGWVIAPDRSGQTTFWIGVAGSNRSQAEAAQALQAGLASPRRLLGDKVNGRLALLHQTRVTLPDAKLQAAFDWGKLNMADLRRTVHDAQIRFVDQGRQYPAPVATIPTLTGIGAGYPDYPWFFGTDGAYTAFPLVVSGQWDTAKNHLRSIRDVSIALN